MTLYDLCDGIRITILIPAGGSYPPVGRVGRLPYFVLFLSLSWEKQKVLRTDCDPF